MHFSLSTSSSSFSAPAGHTRTQRPQWLQRSLSRLRPVGRSGKLLDQYLTAVDLARDKNVFIANIVKCRPPQNRDPLPAESEACMPWLREQFRLIQPKIVVCLGRVAAQRMIRQDFSVTREHGQIINKGGILFMGTFHPAALLRQPQNKPEAFADFTVLRDTIAAVCEHTYNR